MTPHNHVNNQQGFALISVLLFLVLLTVIGIAALNTTDVELQITGNDRIYRTDFYNQEMSLADGKLNYRTWLTTAYLTSDEASAYFPQAGTDASYRVKNNVKVDNPTDDDIPNWEDQGNFDPDDPASHPANQIPILDHRSKPLPGSGYDPKNFEIRRFTITAYSVENDRKVILQEGVYKVFNKYE